MNLYAAQLRDPRLPAKIEESLGAHDLPPSALELEIPETVRLDIGDGERRALCELRARGVGVAFDDYGTGFANFSSLRSFPLTRLKIDRSFVQGMIASEIDRAIVESTLLLGRRLGISVIAEGVETPVQKELLLASGCVEGQGYLFGRPMAASEFTERFIGRARAA